MATASSSLLSSIPFYPVKFRRNIHENTNPTAPYPQLWGLRRRSEAVVGCSSNENGERRGSEKQPSFNPFGFVTDNPSSRSAIQLPEVPAEDGNVGQMLYRIEDKGKDFGSYVASGNLRWFVRETGTSAARRGTIVFVHGAPTQSYSYREVISQMSDAGFHCFAPDWIGFGFSDKPQPGYGFSYTEEEFHKEFEKLLAVLNINLPFNLVVQGFLVGSYGLTWALRNSDKVSKIAILNSPLSDQSSIPGLFQKLSYVLKLEKADVYRLPYLSSSGPGFALLEAARKADFRDMLNRIATGFSSKNWDKQVLLAWGASDKYLRVSEAETFQEGNPEAIRLKVIEGAGHMPQEDWPEKVVEALRSFL